jgi:hypothetical protein
MLAEETNTLFERVFDVIEEDPENLFKTTKIEDRPEANFQVLALKRLQGYSWDKLAIEFKLTGGTLRIFYCHSLQKLKPQLKEYLKNHSFY